MTKTKLPARFGLLPALLFALPIATGLTLPARGPQPAPRPEAAAPAPDTGADAASDEASPADKTSVPTPDPKPAPPVADETKGDGKTQASEKTRDETPEADNPSGTAEETPGTEETEGTGTSKPEPEEKTEPIDPPPAAEDPKALAACLADLRAIGARFEPAAPIDDDGGCGIAAPVTLTKILPDVALEPEATLRCETALQLAKMTRDMLKPAAEAAFPDKPKLTAIRQASGYVCRNRNSVENGKVSEHAYGNAIDIAALRFGERQEPVMIAKQDDGTAEAAFQRAFNAIACLYFTTVLSPGSDPTHQDHMHLDVIKRKSGYRYCR